MKKSIIAIAIAIATLASGSALAHGYEQPTAPGSIEVLSSSIAAAGTSAVVNGSGTAYQGAKVTSTNTSWGSVDSTSASGKTFELENCPPVFGWYGFKTEGLTGTAYSTGSVKTETFGSVTGGGAGNALAYGAQSGSANVEAETKTKLGTLKVDVEAAVAGSSLSTSSNNSFDKDSSLASAGETANAEITQYTKIFGIGPSSIITTLATSQGALCVGGCPSITKVGVNLVNKGDGGYSWGSTYDLGSGEVLQFDASAIVAPKK